MCDNHPKLSGRDKKERENSLSIREGGEFSVQKIGYQKFLFCCSIFHHPPFLFVIQKTWKLGCLVLSVSACCSVWWG